ncbi:MAG: glycosyl hydrolase family 28 protein [Deltaproteobacteria bacterium]|nr:glycosyl hydrolase family 28 protein [Deltaproteobacteria bacterium]
MRSKRLLPSRRDLLQVALPGFAGMSLVGCAHRGRNGVGSYGYDVRAFGAVGNGVVDDTAAVQGALDACASLGGGLVVVPAGVYHIRPIELKSKTTLHLEAGATLLASTRLEDYMQTANKTSHESTRVGLVRAVKADDVSLVGRGAIDGRGTAFITNDLTYPGKDFDRSVTRQGAEYMKEGTVFQHGPFKRGDDRPGNLVHFTDCNNVHIEGITIKNSPTWTSHFAHCRDVLIHGVHIHTRDHDLRIPNDDGIDIEHCKRVRITGCDIETGDDPIAIFSSEDITVSSCVLTTRSTGLRIGYNGPDIRNCVFDNLVIRGANRGLSIFVRAEGSVENILFSNITIETRHFTGRWWGRAEPIHISALRHEGDTHSPGRIRNVGFQNIVASGEAGILIHGAAESIIEDVHFDHMRLRITKGDLQKDYGGNLDLRSTNNPKTAVVQHDIPALYARFVRGLRVEDFQVSWDEGVPDYFTNAIAVEDFEDVRLYDVRVRQAHAEGAAISLLRGKDVAIRESRADAGTDQFVHHQDVTGRLLLDRNDTRLAKKAVSPDAGATVTGDAPD